MTATEIRKHSDFIIRIGLALVFLANSYTAFVSPDDFGKLISRSFLASLLPVSLDWFVKFIGVSDGTVALLLFFGIGPKYVASYATLWILGVMAVIGVNQPGDFLEHFGPLAMALYLVIKSDKTLLK